MSEAQKYQGHLYRPEKEKKGGKQQNKSQSNALVHQPQQQAYVEEEKEPEYHHNSHIEIVDPPMMPEAPSPPSAAPGFSLASKPVNVFDFLVNSESPNASRLEITAPEPMNLIEDAPMENTRSLARVRFGDAAQSVSDLVEYGNGPVPSTGYQTPAPKSERERKKDRKVRDHTKEDKKDKKRKRLHVETRDLSPHDDDQPMTDAPVLHSGLTGGLGRLLSRPSVFPPSPDYSGDNIGDNSPGSPLKKTKHKSTSKRGRVDSIGNNLMSLITPKRVSSRDSDEHPKRKHRKHREGSERPSRKMITNGDTETEDSQNAMVVYQPQQPPAEMLLGYVNKGPDSDRGVSMNKALKRYHRDREQMGSALSKGGEEKELWKSLRMKKNDRGEIVLFI